MSHDRSLIPTRSVTGALVLKDLKVKPLPNIDDKTTPTADQVKQLNDAEKTYFIILSSLSDTVEDSLSDKAKDIRNPDPQYLWNELERQYSASLGARQAQLFQELFNTRVLEGENPDVTMALLKSAYSQINSGNPSCL
ncbi:hypothetical protein L486_08299 [Kwoniella mangroviensis CBS 10435]|uniref:Uncharacterized protein n=1 Tax=Kwoniella mangroviensis CBS 10435 TaxID=1331196 RepID=A0A1B9IEY8_9TREE|nr:hypothetical protein L486_08299 [Kwoniella mangroviensis CBS 10435]